ncbi:keratin-associated protein 4-9-like [Cimex lectularius]|uniref:Uncharacterized protein n=1 Tax=Cimex lectularius TaxID=79782 RepID=A0A8I6SCF2_CIMLE|nr:keratin-associated protein 4-9-like [Cimex lectularius]
MAGRGLAKYVCKTWTSFLKPKLEITNFSRNVSIKNKCPNDTVDCINPCLSQWQKVCDKPRLKCPPCPKKPCLPPIHMCPYDDPCFHCPYTPPPCPKTKDACCKRACCPPYNPYQFRDVCCLPKHPNRITDAMCPEHCKVKRNECCPCQVCTCKDLKCERSHNFTCCPPKLPEKMHCCTNMTDKKICPKVAECGEPKCTIEVVGKACKPTK